MMTLGVAGSARSTAVTPPITSPPMFVGVSALAYASRTNSDVPVPSGTTDNDYCLVTGFTGGGTPATLTAPGGFTLLAGPVSIGAGGFNATLSVWGKPASGEGSTWGFTHTINSTEFVALTYRGVNLTTPIDVAPTTAQGLGSTATWTGLTTVTDNALLVAVESDWGDNSNDCTPPTGYTERRDGIILYASDKEQASLGVSGSPSHTNNSNSGYPWAAILLALRPQA